jgi:hypothetical protein
MLTVYGKNHARGGFCDGIKRRDFLTIGGTIVGSALGLPNLLSAESRSGIRHSHRAIINIYLPGGPPHIDMWDLKPDAPVEIRGDFKPIRTKVPGIDICELFPKIAAMMDKFVIIRSLVDNAGDHDAYQCMTGRKKNPMNPNYWPASGAWVSKAMGPVNQAMPPHMTMMYRTGEPRWGDPGTGGYLGLAHAPFRLVGGKENNLKSDNMTLNGVTLEGLNNRVGLLQAFDSMNRRMDVGGVMDGMDSYRQQALGILTDSKLVDALDLSKESPKIVERYGVNDPAFERDGAPRMVRNFCIARRLVEAGARVVSMNFTRWDWHGGDGMNFVQAKKDFPLLDTALSSLVTDLHERGLDKDVSIVVWGEFGRTPKLNKMNSRDHWPQLNAAVMAGGGMRTGQVIGASDKHADHAVKRPVTHQEVFATLYHNIGMNVSAVREFDPNGRPNSPVDPGVEPLHELI